MVSAIAYGRTRQSAPPDEGAQNERTSPLAPEPAQHEIPALSRYVILTNGCWEWQGAIGGGGYGYLRFKGLLYRAHRFFYERLVGPIPDGLELDHTCHNDDLTCAGGPLCRHRRCVNPAHVEPVEHAINARRGRTGRARTLHKRCRKGHPLTSDNVYTRSNGKRRCRTCTLAKNAEYTRRKAHRALTSR